MYLHKLKLPDSGRCKKLRAWFSRPRKRAQKGPLLERAKKCPNLAEEFYQFNSLLCGNNSRNAKNVKKGVLSILQPSMRKKMAKC